VINTATQAFVLTQQKNDFVPVGSQFLQLPKLFLLFQCSLDVKKTTLDSHCAPSLNHDLVSAGTGIEVQLFYSNYALVPEIHLPGVRLGQTSCRVFYTRHINNS